MRWQPDSRFGGITWISFWERLFSIADRELGGMELLPKVSIDAEVRLKGYEVGFDPLA